ncbi:MAG: type IV pilin N-terminal domain-containing protein [Methanosarcinaceae archaeon]|nr:type IV pilin N-terminal domain-containing protein [Methanosarcinaceae archaeon]
MSKANQFVREEDAVSPVIGVILMVAITVILAAVIAAFVFGMGPPEQAPQAAIRGSAVDVGTNATIKLEHQGGDAVTMTEAATKITVSGSTISGADGEIIDANRVIDADGRFEAGDVWYIALENTTLRLGNTSINARSTTSIADPGDILNVKLIDVASQQMIADLDVRF